MSFTLWLRAQAHRPDLVGDLARDAARDRNLSADASPDEVRDRLYDFFACEGAVEALDRAVAEWAAL